MKTGEACNRTVAVGEIMGDKVVVAKDSDDLLEIVAEELEDIVHAIGNEQNREARRRR